MFRNDGASSWFILWVGYVLSDSITRNIHLFFLISYMCRYVYVQDLNYYFCVPCCWFPSSVYLLLILCSSMEEDIYKIILNPLYVSIHLEFLRLTENQTRFWFWRAKHWLCQVFVLLAKFSFFQHFIYVDEYVFLVVKYSCPVTQKCCVSKEDYVPESYGSN